MINKSRIQSANPGDRLQDNIVKGLGLYFNKDSISWKYCYRVRSTGKQCRPKIGCYPAMSLKQAREVATEMAVKVMKGEDPAFKEKVITLDRIFEEFIRTYTGKRKPQTLRAYQSLWNSCVPRSIKRADIRAIKRHQVASVHRGLRGATGNRFLALISRLYTFAFESDYCGAELNPARGVERHTEQPRDRVATGGELGRIGSGINLFRNSIHPGQRQFADLLALIILTGARVGEWRTAESSWVDINKRVLNLPDSKTGKKSISLPEEAINIIRPKLKDKYLFQNPVTHEPIVQIAKPWGLFKRLNNINKDLRLHDLRRSYASYALEEGLDLNDISKLLGHSNVLITDKVYAKMSQDKKGRAADKAAETMMKRLAG